MRISKFKIRALLISLITLLIVPSFVFGATRGRSYLTVRGLKLEAERLAEKGEYREASSKLAETERKWTTDKNRSEIQESIKLYSELAESKNYFDKARIFYNEGNYEKAIELFEKVLTADVNYQSAQTWLVLAKSKLAEDEKNENGGSVAAGDTQSTDVFGDFNQIIPQTATDLDDSSKLQKIKNLFARIGALNGQLSVLGYIGVSTTSPCDIDKWGKQYLPNGEYNPSFILDPAKQNEMYQQCLAGQSSSSLSSSADLIIQEIKNVNKEIESIIDSCSTSQCSEYYWSAVRILESQGYIMR